MSTVGSNTINRQDTRNEEWGKISITLGILEEVHMGANRLEAGLLHHILTREVSETIYKNI